jgi:hypothetical protein
MKLSREIVLIIGLLLVCSLEIHCTFGRGLSTPDERAKAINIARLLERDPLGKDAPANRQWLLNWIIEVPDIRFKTCVDLLSPGVGSHYRYSTEINQQVIFSAAAFKLEDPDHLRNDTGSYIAGVEGALHAYEILVKSAPEAKLAFLDDLVAKRDRGELADHVIKLASEKCKRPKTELILNLVGAGVGLVLSVLIARWLGRRRIPRVTGTGSVTPRNGSTNFATIAQRLVFLCVAYYMIVLIVLHILQPQFDPRFRFMSEYALGDYVAHDHNIFRAGLGRFRSRSRTSTAVPIIMECTHRNWSTGGRCAVHMSGRCIQRFLTSPFSWRGSLSKHRHGGVAFVMDLSANGRVANDLQSNALHCSWNASNVLVDGRRCRNARIAAASFHFPIPIVAFDCRSQVGSSNKCRLTNRWSRQQLCLVQNKATYI